MDACPLKSAFWLWLPVGTLERQMEGSHPIANSTQSEDRRRKRRISPFIPHLHAVQSQNIAVLPESIRANGAHWGREAAHKRGED